MNDMLIIGLLGFIGTLIAVMTPIIRLNTSITRLNVTMENIGEDNKEIKVLVKDVSCRVDTHDKRIFVLEEKHK